MPHLLHISAGDNAAENADYDLELVPLINKNAPSYSSTLFW